MKILVTGANGFLGQHLCVYLKQKGFDVLACSRGYSRIPPGNNIGYFSAELTDENAVKQLIAITTPDIVIHTAAMSKPDECELNKEKCLLHNVDATRYLLGAFEEISNPDSHFIFISTDFVFGENGPHAEDDIPSPLNFYGESKLQAEKLFEDRPGLNAIVRPVFIYGPVWEGIRSSYLQQVRNALQQNQSIKAVSDQRRTPTYVYDVCKGIEQIIIQKKKGVYHLAGKDILSPYQMAVAVADHFQLDKSLIEEVTLSSFFEAARRPLRSGLKIEKAKWDLHYDPVSFRKGIALSFNQ